MKWLIYYNFSIIIWFCLLDGFKGIFKTFNFCYILPCPWISWTQSKTWQNGLVFLYSLLELGVFLQTKFFIVKIGTQCT